MRAGVVAALPDRLAGEQIPLGARIIGVANAYDQLVSATGGDASAAAQARDILCSARASEFDPLVVGALKVLAPGARL